MSVVNEAKDASSFVEDDATESIISRFTPSQAVEDDNNANNTSTIGFGSQRQAHTEDWRHDTKLLRAEKRILELEIEVMQSKNAMNENKRLQEKLQELETKAKEYEENNSNSLKDLQLVLQDIIVDKLAEMKRTKEAMARKQSRLESAQRELEDKNALINEKNAKIQDMGIILREMDTETTDLKNSINVLKKEKASAILEKSRLSNKNSDLTDKIQHLKILTESLTNGNESMMSKMRRLNVKNEEAETRITSFKKLITKTITTLDLMATSWKMCHPGEKPHGQQGIIDPGKMARFPFKGIIQQNEPDYLTMCLEYRRTIIEHRDNDHSHMYRREDIDDNGEPLYFVPTGDHLRGLFTTIDTGRNNLIEDCGIRLGFSHALIGNYAARK
ncbi:hypothetical protein BS50DRAFT_676226 [Corynespora cassiicola Philippines]|uniref:Uncharacterized protein n=1 Tax=Corynespora cassiicola Philippines TaxID=1448308 RepID=A0A2T2NSG9_CORCC|nr:hypothetical protein BS50DRAFT_676226 [Corynespora cassiicola Philippines]